MTRNHTNLARRGARAGQDSRGCNVLGLAEGFAIDVNVDNNLLNSTETNLFCQREFRREFILVFARRGARAASGMRL